MRIVMAVMAGWFSGYAVATERHRKRIERKIEAAQRDGSACGDPLDGASS